MCPKTGDTMIGRVPKSLGRFIQAADHVPLIIIHSRGDHTCGRTYQHACGGPGQAVAAAAHVNAAQVPQCENSLCIALHHTDREPLLIHGQHVSL